MIKIIDKTKRLKERNTDPFDENRIVNESMAQKLNAIKKGLSDIETSEDVEIIISGNIDDLEFNYSSSDELSKQIKRIITKS